MKNVKEIEYTIESEKWNELLDKAFNNKVKNTEIDGFRKGKCPKEVFIKKFGIESLFSDAADLALNDAYITTVKDNNLTPVVPGNVDIKEVNEEHITFKFTIIEKPEVKLGKYTKLDVKKEEVEVTEEEITEEINHLREQFADIVEETEGEVKLGDTAVINFEGYVDGEKLEGGTGENYPLELGSNTFIPGFEEGVVGMKVGEEKELNIKFPEEYVEELKNKDVTFKVTLTKIQKRVLPEINEEFYKDLGYENVTNEEELNEEIKKHLMEHKNQDAENNYLDELIKTAVENMEVEINPEIINAEKDMMIDEYRQQLQMQGLSLEQYLEFTKGNIDTLKENIEPQAIARIKTRYLLEAIIEKEKLETTEEEVDKEIKDLAQKYETTEDEIIKHYAEREVIKYDLTMRKALEVLKK